VSGSSDKDGHRWWKGVALALGAAAAAAIAWGFSRPEPEEELDDGLLVEEVVVPAPPPATPQPAPWVKPTIWWTVALILGVGVALYLIGVFAEVLTYLLLALFFSFALEPAVNRLARRGWKRGLATGLLLFVTFAVLIFVFVVFVGALLRGAAGILAQVPDWSDTAAAHLEDWFGIHLSTDAISSSANDAAAALASQVDQPGQVLLGISASLVGGIFAMFTVGMFIFYMVAEGPQFKRTVLSLFRRERQEELVSIWEAAIDKTGGYFYSKLLLAVINGGLFFVVLTILGVPGAVALATFQGVVAEFIPIVGTYIAAIVPLVVAFFTVGMPETLWLLIYVLIYQQVENYLLAPKFQSRTMKLHPAVAFGAALAGGAIGGLLWAFLAIPFAATIQASASLWIETHEVLETELTAEPVVVVREPKHRARSAGSKIGGALRSTRGWLRRRREHEDEPPELPPPTPDAPPPAAEVVPAAEPDV
jgi:predicted PurR-regulated permease PerM